MEIFKNKFLVKLIATVCLFLALISFGAPTKVYAADDDDDLGWGGVLITPVVKLLTALGDGIFELLHSSVQSQQLSMIKIDGSVSWNKIALTILAVAIGLVVAAVVIVGIVSIGGIATALISTALGATAAGAGATITLGVVVAGGATGVLVGTSLYEGWIPNDLYLPAFSLTAEEIFSNEIALFDVNFFDTSTKYTKIDTVTENVDYDKRTLFTSSVDSIQDNSPKWVKFYYIASDDTISQFWENDAADSGYIEQFKSKSEFNNYDWSKYNGGNISISDYTGNEALLNIIEQINKGQREDGLNELSFNTGHTIIGKGYNNSTENNFVTCLKILSPKGNVQFTIYYTYASGGEGPQEITIIREAGSLTISTEKEVAVDTTAQKLNGVVSKWYFILQNLALLALMVVLIYTGIRIVLASTAGDKAKYKERLIDWIVAMCLLFVMHYIMVFAVNIVDKITDLVKAETGLNGNFADIPLTNDQFTSAKAFFVDDEYGRQLVTDKVAELDKNQKRLIWRTDLVGLFRIQSQLTAEGTGKWMGYSFAYCVLVIFTLVFAWTYLKRIVYMAFLTMIAPLVAMTYPIDKITDGKAQAFNAWLKEYIFNLLIQPMHLLLYAVLVSSAYELATESAIYALVALGFMIPAEKLLRKFFGFEKASTPGLLGGAAGAALAMTGINKLLGHRPKGGSSGGKSSGGNESKDSAKINFKSKDAVSGMKGIAGQPTEDAQVQDSEDSNIRTNESDTEERGNPREIGASNRENQNSGRNNSRDDGDYSSDAEAIFEDMYGPDSNVSQKQETPKLKTPEELKRERNEADWNKFNEDRKLSNKIKGNMQNIKSGAKNVIEKPLIRGTLASSGAYYRALKNRVVDKIANGHPIRAMARGAAGLAGAAAGGAVGLAMGVVSGDPSKAFQYASAGVLGGQKLASSTVGAAQKATSVDQDYLKEQYELAAYGDEYKNHVLEQEKQKMQKDEKYINYLQKTMSLSRAGAKKVLRETGSKCFDAGITNVEDIATIHKMTEGEDGISINEAIGAKKFNDLLPSDVSKMSQKKKDEYIDTWKKDYKDAGYGADAEKWAKKSMEYAIRFSDAQSSLKKSKV